MNEVSRRRFVGLAASTLGPAEFAALLAQLTVQPSITMDEYSRGGAVAELEQRFAATLGKEVAVFLPSGTLANHLAVRMLAGERRRVIVLARADTGRVPTPIAVIAIESPVRRLHGATFD